MLGERERENCKRAPPSACPRDWSRDPGIMPEQKKRVRHLTNSHQAPRHLMIFMSFFFLLELLFLFLLHSISLMDYNYIFENSLLVTLIKHAYIICICVCVYKHLICFVSCGCNNWKHFFFWIGILHYC